MAWTPRAYVANILDPTLYHNVYLEQWFAFHVCARLAMLVSVSGCLSPSTLFLVFITLALRLPLAPKRQRQVGHARERVWVLWPKGLCPFLPVLVDASLPPPHTYPASTTPTQGC